jgi:hypothetical protein
MNTEDKMEMLRWLSLRNAHMAPSELAFLLDIPMAESDEGEEHERRVPVQ